MRLLIIGGTSFVGRAIVDAALARQHEVTTVNRGRTGPDVPGVRALRGDRSRADGLAALTGLAFDAAIDPGGLIPAHVLRAVRALADTVPYFAYVSSLSAYENWRGVSVREDSPLQDCPPDEDGSPDVRAYGRRKAGCERAVRLVYHGDASLVVRPGTIVGPYDNVGQLPWWLNRFARGGPLLAPGDPDQGLQLLDVRDLARFVLDHVEQGRGGCYNAVPEGANTTMRRLFDDCREATGTPAEPVWMTDEFLVAHAAPQWIGVPLWVPTMPENSGVWTASGEAARAAGLRPRPVRDSVRDTWDWLRGGGEVRPMEVLPPVGLEPSVERALLAEWLAQGP